ncbi:MAG: translation initiation factor IF-2 subunit gamma [Candidatus Aenigmarchaeota archaeon]|nr:translation initiation factor IF-2 subunit gamma [Candidatus Aenigmarchaeota archaeon]
MKEGNAVKQNEIDSRLIPQVNIGMVGHVSHGKTTLTKALTGKLTLTHSEELKRGITIRLGYADSTIYKCTKCKRLGPNKKCIYCFSDAEPERTISFIDAPGHETLMATVLTGAGLMDGAILLIAANEKCPQPQTREHLTALEVVGIKNVIIVQSKIDLVTKEQALENYKQIKEFIKGSPIEDAPIIPVSAQYNINIDVLFDTIEKIIPTSKRNLDADPLMYVARSFNLNKPGSKPKDLSGGVLGGSVIQGTFREGDEIEIRPGVLIKNNYQPLKTTIHGLRKGEMNLKEAGAGGLLGLLTNLDPSLTKSDGLVGNVVGLPGKLPQSVNSLRMELHLLERVVGAKEILSMEPLKINETLLVNIGTSRSVGNVSLIKKNVIELKLKLPICISKNDRVVISRQVQGRWRLVGYGILKT